MPNYTYKKKTQEQLNSDNRDKYQKKHKFGNVRQAVLKQKPDAYQKIDQIMTSENDADRQPKIHHARGKEQSKTGYVFELSIAGSEFTEFRAVHREMCGKHAIQPDAKDKTKRFELQDKPLKVHWYNKAFGWLPFVNSPKDIQKLNQASEMAKERLDDYYGKQWVNPQTGKQDKYIRTKQVNDKVFRVSLPGPPGMLDRGERSINGLRDKTLYFAQQYLTEKFEAFKNGSLPEEPIHVNLKGHSRGGVAAGEGMQMIMAWTKKNYPEYADKVKYDLVQFEPVPGRASQANHENLDLDSKLVGDKQGKVERANAPKENVNSTVYYSLCSAEDPTHKLFFDPQKVKGASRIVLMPKRHMLDLADADMSQPDKSYKVGYSDAKTGDLYKGSGISDLEEGVFIVDENNTLVKLDSPEMAMNVIKDVTKNMPYQANRHEFLKECVNSWFERNLPEKVEERNACKNDIVQHMDSLPKVKENPDAVPMVKNPKIQEMVAKEIYLQSVLKNADTISLKDLRNATDPKIMEKNVKAIKSSDRFQKLVKENDGKLVKLTDLTDKFEEMGVKYPGKVEKKLQAVGTVNQVKEASKSKEKDFSIGLS